MKAFKFLFVYDDMIVFLSYGNGIMLMKWLSSRDHVHVFMCSYIEAAEAENTAIRCVCVVNKTVRLLHSFTQNMQDSNLNDVFTA